MTSRMFGRPDLLAQDGGGQVRYLMFDDGFREDAVLRCQQFLEPERRSSALGLLEQADPVTGGICYVSGGGRPVWERGSQHRGSCLSGTCHCRLDVVDSDVRAPGRPGFHVRSYSAAGGGDMELWATGAPDGGTFLLLDRCND